MSDGGTYFFQDDEVIAMDEDISILQKADVALQESLVGEVFPDPMEGEQTWPTDEEIKEAGKVSSKNR